MNNIASHWWKLVLIGIGLILVGVLLASCSDEADVVSENISKDADNFKIVRKIVFYNTRTDVSILVVEGNCNIEIDEAEEQFITSCKLGDDAYKKHYLGLTEGVTYFAEQLEIADVSSDHYKVTLNPSAVIPDPELR